MFSFHVKGLWSIKLKITVASTAAESLDGWLLRLAGAN